MSAHGDVPIAVRAMKLGAIEFLEKPFPVGALDHALDHAFGLLDAVVQSRTARTEACSLLDRLSPRELEIMTILTAGAQNKVVGHKLGISVRTVEMHRANALGKLGLKSIAEVMAVMLTAGVHPAA
jgi:two-component system response regulator FixJ